MPSLQSWLDYHCEFFRDGLSGFAPARLVLIQLLVIALSSIQ